MSQFESSPPTFGEPDFGEPVVAWPKVVGIVSIVWASLGLVCVGCGAIGVASQSFLLNMASQQGAGSGQQIPPAPDVMKAGAVDYFAIVVGFLLAVHLLIAGIMLLRRSNAARMLHLLYGVAAIIVTAISTFFQYNKQQAMVEWANQNPDNFWATQQQQGAMYATIGLLIGVVLGLAYPIFLLVWFGLIKKRPEDMGPPPQELVA